MSLVHHCRSRRTLRVPCDSRGVDCQQVSKGWGRWARFCRWRASVQLDRPSLPHHPLWKDGIKLVMITSPQREACDVTRAHIESDIFNAYGASRSPAPLALHSQAMEEGSGYFWLGCLSQVGSAPAGAPMIGSQPQAPLRPCMSGFPQGLGLHSAPHGWETVPPQTC